MIISCQKKELSIKELTINEIPDNIAFAGKLIEAKKWSDRNGDNILIISRYGPYRTTDPLYPENEFDNVELHALQYLVNNGSQTLLWQTSETIKECITDMFMELIPNSTSITDLDKNGITETTILYRYSCRGDVSPSKMKVCLHEGKQSYCLQGDMILEYQAAKLDKKTFEFNLSNVTSEEIAKYKSNPWDMKDGRYIDDLDFNSAPPEFLAYSKAKWIEFCDKDSTKQFYPADYQEAKVVDKHKP